MNSNSNSNGGLTRDMTQEFPALKVLAAFYAKSLEMMLSQSEFATIAYKDELAYRHAKLVSLIADTEEMEARCIKQVYNKAQIITMCEGNFYSNEILAMCTDPNLPDIKTLREEFAPLLHTDTTNSNIVSPEQQKNVAVINNSNGKEEVLDNYNEKAIDCDSSSFYRPLLTPGHSKSAIYNTLKLIPDPNSQRILEKAYQICETTAESEVDALQKFLEVLEIVKQKLTKPQEIST